VVVCLFGVFVVCFVGGFVCSFFMFFVLGNIVGFPGTLCVVDVVCLDV
jgi:nitrate reductase NapE component